MIKNILYIAPSSGLGGAETFLKNTWLSHNKEQFQPLYLVFQKGPLSDWLLQNGAPVLLLSRRPRLSRPWTFWTVHREIKKIIAKHRIDMVHSTMAYGALFSGFAAWRSGIPHVWFQHGPASGWMDQLAALVPHQAVLVNSQFTKTTQLTLEKPLSRWIPKHREIHLITLGVHEPQVSEKATTEFKQRLVKPHNLKAQTLIVGMACRLQKWKGVSLAMDAVLKVSANHPIAFFVWGEAFGSDDTWKELVAKTQKGPLFLEGPTANVPLAFSACDVVVNASLQPEPFGLTIIEALSVGTPVIVPDEGGPREIIEEGVNGLRFRPRSAESLAHVLENFILNPNPNLKTRARESFEKNFTSRSMIENLESVYLRILKSSAV